MRGTEHVWRSGDNVKELVLSFHQVGPGARTQVMKLGGKRLYPLSHLIIGSLLENS